MNSLAKSLLASGLALGLGIGSATTSAPALAGEAFGSSSNDSSVFLTAMDFQGIFDTTCPLSHVGNTYFSSCGGTYYAPFELPEGALLKNWRVSFQDNVAGDFDVSLRRASAPWSGSASIGSLLTLSSYTSAGASADYQFPITGYTHTYDTVTNDGDHHSYFARASIPAGGVLRGVWIFYQRQIGPAPASATFADVPTTHPFFREVENLSRSGITQGCGVGQFCPDAAVTRGQMAAFLSRALGLHVGLSTDVP